MYKLYKGERTVINTELDSMQPFFNFYDEINISYPVKYQWVKDYIEANRLPYNIDNIPPDYITRPIPHICRMILIGVVFSDKRKEWLHNKLKEYHDYNLTLKVVEQQEPKKERKAPIEIVKENAKTYYTYADMVINGEEKSLLKLLKSANLGQRYSKQVKEYIESLETLDSDLKGELIVDCEKWLNMSKKDRKPHKKKEKSYDDLLKLFTYCKKWNTIESVNPEKLFGAKVVITYHTVKKQLGVYLAKNGMTVHRSSLKDYDSDSFYINKVEDMKIIKEAIDLKGDIGINKFRNDIKHLEKIEASGRINDSVIILNAF